MVKAWAEDFVNEYETGFAHKIDWDAAKQVYGTTWFEEKRGEWTYRWGVRYFPADIHGGETYDVSFKKIKILDPKHFKIFQMSAYKGCGDKKKQYMKRGDGIYQGFH